MLNQLPDFLLPCEQNIYILYMSYVPYSTAYMKHYSTLSSSLFFSTNSKQNADQPKGRDDVCEHKGGQKMQEAG